MRGRLALVKDSQPCCQGATGQTPAAASCGQEAEGSAQKGKATLGELATVYLRSVGLDGSALLLPFQGPQLQPVVSPARRAAPFNDARDLSQLKHRFEPI
jgi:hypothetical protein